MAFHEVQFPPKLSFGAVGGPERRVEIVTLASGAEERNALWAGSRRRWDAGLGMRGLDDLHALVAFFEARGGPLYGFRWKDWSDHLSCLPSGVPAATDQRIGTGDGARASFDLVKRYESGPAAYERRVTKPVAASVRVAVGGVEVPFACDYGAGVVTLAAPPAPGAVVTAGFAFDVPVRFDVDRIAISVATFEAGEAPEVPVVEVLS